MPQDETINTSDLLKQAKASQHNEAYRIMNKTVNYRVGIGARLTLAPTQMPSFFIEIIINLCPACNKVDLVFLEKALTCLKELQKIGYSLTCQDDNDISCEKLVPKENIDSEYKAASIMMEQSFP